MRRPKARAVAVALAGVAIVVLAPAWATTRGQGKAAAPGRIVFERNDRIYVMNADGSGQRRMGLPGYPVWSPNGRKIAFDTCCSSSTGLYVANANGSARREIMHVSAYNCLAPSWSPEGRKLLYTLDCDVDFQSIGVINADGTGRKELTGTWNQNPVWSPDGRTIVFTTNPRPHRGFRLMLMDQHGRGKRTVPGGYPDPEPTPRSMPAWSRDGKTIFFLTYWDGRLLAIGRDGRGLRDLAPQLDKVRDFSLSPDGTRIALSAPGSPDRGWEVYTVDADGSHLQQLTDNRAYDIEPRWSPDGSWLAFTSTRDGNSEVYVMHADGSEQTDISESPATDETPSWVPNAR